MQATANLHRLSKVRVINAATKESVNQVCGYVFACMFKFSQANFDFLCKIPVAYSRWSTWEVRGWSDWDSWSCRREQSIRSLCAADIFSRSFGWKSRSFSDHLRLIRQDLDAKWLHNWQAFKKVSIYNLSTLTIGFLSGIVHVTGDPQIVTMQYWFAIHSQSNQTKQLWWRQYVTARYSWLPVLVVFPKTFIWSPN